MFIIENPNQKKNQNAEYKILKIKSKKETSKFNKIKIRK